MSVNTYLNNNLVNVAKATQVQLSPSDQVSFMPTASVSNEGYIYQYIGTSTEDYINGYFYKCVSDGAATPAYSWQPISTQPTQAAAATPYTDTDGYLNADNVQDALHNLAALIEPEEWKPLNDGYTNFWFELTDDTLSPWLNFSAKTENAVIDWGDGSGEVTLDTLTPTHTYSKAGKYVVKVKGVTGIAVQHTVPYQGEYLTVLRAVETNAEVVSSEQYGFAYCSGLSHVSLLALALSAYIFYRSGMLFDVQIASGETKIPTRGFSGCYALQSVSLPQSVETINVYAFTSCIALRNITIPSGVTNLGNYAFQACSSLQEVHILATTPPTVYAYTFDSLPTSYIIYVPVGTGDTYKAASGWSAYADHILEEGQTPNRTMLSEPDTDNQ